MRDSTTTVGIQILCLQITDTGHDEFFPLEIRGWKMRQRSAFSVKCDEFCICLSLLILSVVCTAKTFSYPEGLTLFGILVDFLILGDAFF